MENEIKRVARQYGVSEQELRSELKKKVSLKNKKASVKAIDFIFIAEIKCPSCEKVFKYETKGLYCDDSYGVSFSAECTYCNFEVEDIHI